jgi:hypothetical protein
MQIFIILHSAKLVASRSVSCSNEFLAPQNAQLSCVSSKINKISSPFFTFTLRDLRDLICKGKDILNYEEINEEIALDEILKKR